VTFKYPAAKALLY